MSRRETRTVNEITALHLDDELARIQIKITMAVGLALDGFDAARACDSIMEVRKQVRIHVNKNDLSEI